MKFTAQKREGVGTSAAKKIRKADLVPGTVYAKDIAPINIQMATADVELIEREYGTNSVFDLDIEGDETRTVFLRDIDKSALKPIIYNISFQAITKGEKLDIEVPVRIVNEESLGDADGIASTILWEVPLRIDPSKAPEEIEVNVEGLHIGDTVTIADLKFDGIEDAEFLEDESEVVVAISAPDEEPSAEEAAEEATEGEPEVINEKPDEEA